MVIQSGKLLLEFLLLPYVILQHASMISKDLTKWLEILNQLEYQILCKCLGAILIFYCNYLDDGFSIFIK